VTWVDPELGCRGYAVIDRLIDGLAGGGIRMCPGVTLAEVEHLARVMTHKKALAGALGGGAKGGIDFDPADPRATEVLRRYVATMAPLFRVWWSAAGDLGVAEEQLAAEFAECGLGLTVQALVDHTADPVRAAQAITTALEVSVDGLPLSECTAGYGVAQAVVAALELTDRPRRAATVAVQGFGSVGGATARFLAAEGIRVVGIADVAGLVVDPNGHDIDVLLSARDRAGRIDRSRLPMGTSLLPSEAWLALDVDVLVPAARGNAIDIGDCQRIRAGVIVEAANLPTTSAAQVRLREQGVVVVPDLVASSGTTAWFTWLATGEVGPAATPAFARLERLMGDVVPAVVRHAEERGVTTHEAARQLADRRLGAPSV
jgi:glutamate dehydrogenase (NAD(P)+)